MRRTIATACVLAILLGGVWAQQSSPPAPALHKSDVAKDAAKKPSALKKAHRVGTPAAPAPAAPVPAQVAPPLPAALMNSAPVTPKVTMEGGLLTIDAPNSTLRDVLNGVQKATGASVEGASPSERVAVRLGPGDPEQVIAALLHGTPYDYVIMGSLGRRDVVTRVLLSQSGGGSSSGQGQEGWHRPPVAVNQPQVQQEDQSEAAAPPEEVAPQPVSEPEQAEQPQPPQPPQTPDQLFRQLQQSDRPPRQPAEPQP